MNQPTTTPGEPPSASANPETNLPAPSADEIRKAIETLVALALPLDVKSPAPAAHGSTDVFVEYNLRLSTQGKEPFPFRGTILIAGLLEKNELPDAPEVFATNLQFQIMRPLQLQVLRWITDCERHVEEGAKKRAGQPGSTSTATPT